MLRVVALFFLLHFVTSQSYDDPSSTEVTSNTFPKNYYDILVKKVVTDAQAYGVPQSVVDFIAQLPVNEVKELASITLDQYQSAQRDLGKMDSLLNSQAHQYVADFANFTNSRLDEFHDLPRDEQVFWYQILGINAAFNVSGRYPAAALNFLHPMTTFANVATENSDYYQTETGGPIPSVSPLPLDYPGTEYN